MTDRFDIPGLEFFDLASQRMMKYVYPDTRHWTAGWILFQHPDGQWVTLRKATDQDVEVINRAVVAAHHGEACG
jgi:hypothetical protein